MIRLDELAKAFRPQFIWEREGKKYLQTSEEVEGSKEIARTIFVGIADMLGFNQSDVMDYLDCGYDSYRHKLMAFREIYREGVKRHKAGTIYAIDDNVKKFYIKAGLCLNAIKFNTKRDPYFQLAEYICL